MCIYPRAPSFSDFVRCWCSLNQAALPLEARMLQPLAGSRQSQLRCTAAVQRVIVMLNDDAYRWHAQIAWDKADRATTPEDKVIWKMMAQAWAMLAAGELYANSPEANPIGPQRL